MPGLARYYEVAAGRIDHALRFTAPYTQWAYIYPARHFASDETSTSLPPMGLRVRLKASVDISRFGPQAKVVVTALKQFGMFLADNGSPLYVTGVPTPTGTMTTCTTSIRSSARTSRWSTRVRCETGLSRSRQRRGGPQSNWLNSTPGTAINSMTSEPSEFIRHTLPSQPKTMLEPSGE